MAKKPLTLKTALYHMNRMWAALAKTGDKNKPITDINCDCYLCEYFCRGCRKENRGRNGSCDECCIVMKAIWPQSCQRNSIFLDWENATTTAARMKYARQIADEAWKQWKLL